jgi:hypothetical protein
MFVVVAAAAGAAAGCCMLYCCRCCCCRCPLLQGQVLLQAGGEYIISTQTTAECHPQQGMHSETRRQLLVQADMTAQAAAAAATTAAAWCESSSSSSRLCKLSQHKPAVTPGCIEAVLEA